MERTQIAFGDIDFVLHLNRKFKELFDIEWFDALESNINIKKKPDINYANEGVYFKGNEIFISARFFNNYTTDYTSLKKHVKKHIIVKTIKSLDDFIINERSNNVPVFCVYSKIPSKKILLKYYEPKTITACTSL